MARDAVAQMSAGANVKVSRRRANTRPSSLPQPNRSSTTARNFHPVRRLAHPSQIIGAGQSLHDQRKGGHHKAPLQRPTFIVSGCGRASSVGETSFCPAGRPVSFSSPSSGCVGTVSERRSMTKAATWRRSGAKCSVWSVTPGRDLHGARGVGSKLAHCLRSLVWRQQSARVCHSAGRSPLDAI